MRGKGDLGGKKEALRGEQKERGEGFEEICCFDAAMGEEERFGQWPGRKNGAVLR